MMTIFMLLIWLICDKVKTTASVATYLGVSMPVYEKRLIRKPVGIA